MNENDKTSLTSNKCVVIVIVIRKVQLFDNEFFQATSEEEFSSQTNCTKKSYQIYFSEHLWLVAFLNRTVSSSLELIDSGKG